MRAPVAQGAQSWHTGAGRYCVHQHGARREQRARRSVSSSPASELDSAYTTDRSVGEVRSVIGLEEDAHMGLRANSWPIKSSMYLFRTDGKSCSRELVTGTGKFQFSHPSTQQHLLVWREKPRVVMVIKKLGAELTQHFLEVVHYLGEVESMLVVVEPAMYDICLEAGLGPSYVFTFSQQDRERLGEHVDFVVCLGGDGVLLHASSLFAGSLPPVLTFHLGSMGFLTNHEFATFRQDLRQVIYGSEALETCTSLNSVDSANRLGTMVTLRMRLHCTVNRRGQPEPEQAYEVLNEVVVDRGSNSYLTNVEVWIGGRFITRVQADGIMLATPTGSTAYSVAAGGSMVHPNVPAILLTPVCPHSLNFRPVILPDYAEVEVRVPVEARCSVWVCFDGKQRQELHRGDCIRVKMSENPVPTINKADLTTDWFDSLERCFKWSDRMEQKPFEMAAASSTTDVRQEVHAFRGRLKQLYAPPEHLASGGNGASSSSSSVGSAGGSGGSHAAFPGSISGDAVMYSSISADDSAAGDSSSVSGASSASAGAQQAAAPVMPCQHVEGVVVRMDEGCSAGRPVSPFCEGCEHGAAHRAAHAAASERQAKKQHLADRLHSSHSGGGVAAQHQQGDKPSFMEVDVRA